MLEQDLQSQALKAELYYIKLEWLIKSKINLNKYTELTHH